MIPNTVKPPFLVLVILNAGFLMYQEFAFSELLFDVVAVLHSVFQPLLSFYFSPLVLGQAE